ncbi:MAG: hypothetical protein OEZ34_04935 [Spirochaetia bacterium]|nr:hypothetical protein [Spirochaetia bacterium]
MRYNIIISFFLPGLTGLLIFFLWSGQAVDNEFHEGSIFIKHKASTQWNFYEPFIDDEINSRSDSSKTNSRENPYHEFVEMQDHSDQTEWPGIVALFLLFILANNLLLLAGVFFIFYEHALFINWKRISILFFISILGFYITHIIIFNLVFFRFTWWSFIYHIFPGIYLGILLFIDNAQNNLSSPNGMIDEKSVSSALERLGALSGPIGPFISNEEHSREDEKWAGTIGFHQAMELAEWIKNPIPLPHWDHSMIATPKLNEVREYAVMKVAEASLRLKDSRLRLEIESWLDIPEIFETAVFGLACIADRASIPALEKYALGDNASDARIIASYLDSFPKKEALSLLKKMKSHWEMKDKNISEIIQKAIDNLQ